MTSTSNGIRGVKQLAKLGHGQTTFPCWVLSLSLASLDRNSKPRDAPASGLGNPGYWLLESSGLAVRSPCDVGVGNSRPPDRESKPRDPLVRKYIFSRGK
jgi:hypothetical protein